MHVKEGLVSNKHSGKLIGFVDIGDINNHLARYEESLSNDDDDTDPTISSPPLAKSMTFMVLGLFTTLKFTYAMFPCVSLKGEQLFLSFWETITFGTTTI